MSPIKKNTIVVMLYVIVSLCMTSCSAHKENGNNLISVLEDHVSEGYEFPSGYYYQYQFSEAELDTRFDEQKVIRRLLHDGLPVRNVWYKEASSACFSPYGVKEGRVDPVLLVQMTRHDDKIHKMGFVATKKPNMGYCAYRIHRYYVQRGPALSK